MEELLDDERIRSKIEAIENDEPETNEMIDKSLNRNEAAGLEEFSSTFDNTTAPLSPIFRKS